MDKTKEVIKEMLTENTGRHFLDSGGAYGRNWERNQDRDFESEPHTHYEADVYDGKAQVWATHNIYHWLAERLWYYEELDERFHKEFVPQYEEEHGTQHWLALMEAFPAWLEETDGGIYGEGQPFTVNSYNGEDALSQVIQYAYFEYDQEVIYLLQIHGGCDVRGGYTAPRVFSDSGMMDQSLMYNAHATLYCPECHANWYTDDNYHWYYDGPYADDLHKLAAYECEEGLDAIHKQYNRIARMNNDGKKNELAKKKTNRKPHIEFFTKVKKWAEVKVKWLPHEKEAWSTNPDRFFHRYKMRSNLLYRFSNWVLDKLWLPHEHDKTLPVVIVKDGKVVCPVCNHEYLEGTF